MPRTALPDSKDRLPDLEVGEALGGRRFWLIANALLLVSTVTQGLVVHTVPLLTDKGYSPETAATLMIAVGLSTMAGRLLSGYLVDRIFAPFVQPSSFCSPALEFTCSTAPSLRSRASSVSASRPVPRST
jgi:predicted MFS family arabinose efflux permease